MTLDDMTTLTVRRSALDAPPQRVPPRAAAILPARRDIVEDAGATRYEQTLSGESEMSGQGGDSTDGGVDTEGRWEEERSDDVTSVNKERRDVTTRDAMTRSRSLSPTDATSESQSQSSRRRHDTSTSRDLAGNASRSPNGRLSKRTASKLSTGAASFASFPSFRSGVIDDAMMIQLRETAILDDGDEDDDKDDDCDFYSNDDVRETAIVDDSVEVIASREGSADVKGRGIVRTSLRRGITSDFPNWPQYNLRTR